MHTLEQSRIERRLFGSFINHTQFYIEGVFYSSFRFLEYSMNKILSLLPTDSTSNFISSFHFWKIAQQYKLNFKMLNFVLILPATLLLTAFPSLDKRIQQFLHPETKTTYNSTCRGELVNETEEDDQIFENCYREGIAQGKNHRKSYQEEESEHLYVRIKQSLPHRLTTYSP